MKEPPPERHVVVAGLLRQRGRILMVHRSPQRRWYPDTWDLPGGHVREEESPREALARELDEELGITAEVAGDPFARIRGVDFRMDVWLVDQWVGDPTNLDPREHDALTWVAADEPLGLRLADQRLPQLLKTAAAASRP